MSGLESVGKLDQASRAAEDFAKLYYNTLDKGRHKLAKFYMDEGARLVWNGNCRDGKEAIIAFYKNLPISESTLISSLDTQPILDEAVKGVTTILVLVAGTIQFQDKPTTPFQQSFVLTVQNDVWKIVTDCFRFQETVI